MSSELLKLGSKLVLDCRLERKIKFKDIVELVNPDKIIISRLHQRAKEFAKPNSLSSKYGLGRFPIHSDFAKYTIPPRYILLSAGKARLTETLIYDPSELFKVFTKQYLERCLFLVGVSCPHYVRILTYSTGKPLFRYNKDIMTPANNEAKVVSQWIEREMPVAFRIDWSYYRTALINNWELWHARNVCNYNQGSALVRLAMWSEVNDLDSRELLQ